MAFLCRNPDCPDKYITAVFFHAVQELTDIKFLQTSQRSGWIESENGILDFASSKSVHPYLIPYYPKDIRERKLINSIRAIRDIAEEYAEALPNIWQYKLLLAIRLTSLLLYFFDKRGIKPDRIFVVESASELVAKTAIALLKTQNYESQVTLPLTATKTELNESLYKANDGMVAIRDSSYAEDRKKRENGLQTLIKNLYDSNGNENNSRHVTTIVSDNSGNFPEEIPVMYINLTERVLVGDTDKLQRLSGEFDAAFISAILNDSQNTKRFIEDIFNKSIIETQTISSSENYNTKRLVRGGIDIMEHFGLITPEEENNIHKWLKNGSKSNNDSSTAIVNDFRSVLNQLIFSRIKIVPQYGVPFYEVGKHMAFVDKRYINMEVEVIENFILPQMKKTKKRLKLLHALNECGKLYSNNGFKRNLDVAISHGEKITVSVYSVSESLLNAENKEKLNQLSYQNYFINNDIKSLAYFNPMLTNKANTKTAGVLQLPDMDMNFHQYISGSSRSGKTKYLCEQAISAAMNGEQVIVIDHNDGFSNHEMEKHIPHELIEKYVSRWEIPKQGLPINFGNLDYCDTLPEKKQRIFGILSAAAQVLGSVQEKVLRKRIGAMLRQTDKITDISQILDFLEENDDIQKALRNKLEDVFEEFDNMSNSSNNWVEFLKSQKRIVVISTGCDSVSKGTHITDMLIASLYSYKQYVPEYK